jgi:hypothetical protein
MHRGATSVTQVMLSPRTLPTRSLSLTPRFSGVNPPRACPTQRLQPFTHNHPKLSIQTRHPSEFRLQTVPAPLIHSEPPNPLTPFLPTTLRPLSLSLGERAGVRDKPVPSSAVQVINRRSKTADPKSTLPPLHLHPFASTLPTYSLSLTPRFSGVNQPSACPTQRLQPLTHNHPKLSIQTRNPSEFRLQAVPAPRFHSESPNPLTPFLPTTVRPLSLSLGERAGVRARLVISHHQSPKNTNPTGSTATTIKTPNTPNTSPAPSAPAADTQRSTLNPSEC